MEKLRFALLALEWMLSVKHSIRTQRLRTLFTHNLQGMEQNYEQALDKFRKDLFSWTNLKLSNEEKDMVIKVYGMPKINHIATILPDPPKETLENRGLHC